MVQTMVLCWHSKLGNFEVLCMRIGIIYASKTGMTKNLAKRAADQLRGMSLDVSLISIEDYDFSKEDKYDLLLIGSYCDSNNYPKQIRRLFDSIRFNKCIASFVTHSTLDEGPYYDRWAAGCSTYFEKYCEENSVLNRGYFHCRSKPSIGVRIFIKLAVFKNSSHDWKEYKKDMNHYPGADEFKRFEEFIASVVE